MRFYDNERENSIVNTPTLSKFSFKLKCNNQNPMRILYVYFNTEKIFLEFF